MKTHHLSAFVAAMFLFLIISVLHTTEVKGQFEHNTKQTNTSTEHKANIDQEREPVHVDGRGFRSPSLSTSLLNSDSTIPETTTNAAKPTLPEEDPVPTKEPEAVLPSTGTTYDTSTMTEPGTEVMDEPASTDPYIKTLIAEIHRLTNRERKRVDLPALIFDDQLADIALNKSQDMADRHYFDHTDPDGCDFSCRFKSTGYSAVAWGENIIWQSSTKTTATSMARDMVDSWMESSTHRENILNPDYTNEGVGVGKDGQEFYVTVNFATPK